MTPIRLAITGMGVVSALGWSLEETWIAIEAGRSGLGPLTLFDSPRCGHFPVGQVPGDPSQRSSLSAGSRSDHLAAYAARQAFQDAGLDRLPEAARRQVGLGFGGTTGGLLDTESFLLGLIREGKEDLDLLRRHECSHPTQAAASLLGLKGFRSTVSTACSSGAAALGMAADVIGAGEASIMLAGGVDSLTRLTLNGFASLLIVSPEGCRPFDARRSGMSLGEGAAVLALETEESAHRRQARIYGYLAGFAHTCDAYHATAPSPDGSGIYRAMAQALTHAGLTPDQVDYVNAHGTGTIDNDLAEGRALARLFGDKQPLISSTKRFLGHTLGAAGALEAVVCLLALEHQRVPANLGLRQPDPKIPIQPEATLSPARLDVALSNSLGFGGACSALVLRRVFSHREERHGP